MGLGATAYSNSYFGAGTIGIFLDDVGCSGSELNLIDCTHSPFGAHNCDHSKDAGVACLGMRILNEWYGLDHCITEPCY